MVENNWSATHESFPFFCELHYTTDACTLMHNYDKILSKQLSKIIVQCAFWCERN